MKKEFYIGLLAVAFLTGCAGDSDSDSDSDDSTTSHYQGQSCLYCHGGTAGKAEGKYFRSGVTIYSGLNTSTAVNGYIVKLLMDNNSTVFSFAAGRGTGNANSGVFNTTLDGYTTNKYTVNITDSTGKVLNKSATNSHTSGRFDCNSCHTAAGTNGAPGRVTPTFVTTSTTPTTKTLSFATHVMPLLEASCKSCHGTSGNFTITTASATYSNITALTNGGLDTNTSTNSYLLQKATNTRSHGGGAIWSTAHTSYITVKTWIDQGALNN